MAGVADADFTFVTMTKDGDLPPPDLIQRRDNHNVAMLDMKAAIGAIVVISSMICIVSIVIICYKQRMSAEKTDQLTNKPFNPPSSHLHKL